MVKFKEVNACPPPEATLVEFIFYSISGGGKLPWLMRCLSSYTPCVTDLFLLENPSSNSQVTKRIQYDALSTRGLV